MEVLFLAVFCAVDRFFGTTERLSLFVDCCRVSQRFVAGSCYESPIMRACKFALHFVRIDNLNENNEFLFYFMQNFPVFFYIVALSNYFFHG